MAWQRKGEEPSSLRSQKQKQGMRKTYVKENTSKNWREGARTRGSLSGKELGLNILDLRSNWKSCCFLWDPSKGPYLSLRLLIRCNSLQLHHASWSVFQNDTSGEEWEDCSVTQIDAFQMYHSAIWMEDEFKRTQLYAHIQVRRQLWLLRWERIRTSRLSADDCCLLISYSVISDSLWPHGLQQARLPCPSPSPRVCSNSMSIESWWREDKNS